MKFRKFTTWAECWIDIQTLNELSKKEFGVQFAPNIRSCGIMPNGFDVDWLVSEERFPNITKQRVRQLIKQVPDGHKMLDNLKVESVEYDPYSWLEAAE